MRLSLITLILASLLVGPVPSRAEPAPVMVIEDNDFLGPAGSDLNSALILLANPRIDVLGFTVVTGDGWRDEETAALLRFLEVAGAPQVPVYPGAVVPLINTRARMAAWEAAYGKLPWKGAWNDPASGSPAHPDDPTLIPPSPIGAPSIKPKDESAVSFLIRAVHAHPHAVTILAAGPMTDLALAIRQDPQFAALAKELVFMGGIIDGNLQEVTDNANFFTDFNFLFDPEAANIALTADWAKITCLGTVTMKTRMDQPLIDRIGAGKAKVAQLIARYAEKFPLWDELAAAIIVDPAIVTGSVEAYMDVEIERGIYYGHAHLWTAATRPHQGERLVTVVTDVDSRRLRDQLVAATQYPGRHP